MDAVSQMIDKITGVIAGADPGFWEEGMPSRGVALCAPPITARGTDRVMH